jgi:hypothetical protein
VILPKMVLRAAAWATLGVIPFVVRLQEISPGVWSDALVTLVTQIPLATLVVVVVYVYLRHLTDWNIRVLNFITDLETRNQAFMEKQQMAHNETIARLAEEIKLMRGDIARVEGVLTAHDTRISERIVQQEKRR